MRPLLLFFSLLPLVACSAAVDAQDATDSALSACGSPEGTVVAISAANGRSTIDGALESRANRVVAGPIVDGRALGDALFDLVSRAKREVLIAMYEIDETSYLAGRLKEALSRVPSDVPVRVLTNPMLGKRFLGLPESREDNTKRIEAFFGMPNVKAAAWDASDLLHFDALHTKYVLVDGARALVADANLQPAADPIGSSPKAQGWYQLGVVVEGEIASAIRKDFVAGWRVGAPDDALPEAPPVAKAAACTHMIALGRNAGDKGSPSANFGYEALMVTAEKAVRVVTPNLNDEGPTHALAEATAHADVYLVMSQHFDDGANSLPGWGGNNEKGLARLVEAAKDPCRLHVRWFAREPGAAVQGNVDGASHAKWASVDGRVMILGSQNLDVQSWQRSREFNVAIDDAATTRAFDAEFERVWARSPVGYECAK